MRWFGQRIREAELGTRLDVIQKGGNSWIRHSNEAFLYVGTGGPRPKLSKDAAASHSRQNSGYFVMLWFIWAMFMLLPVFRHDGAGVFYLDPSQPQRGLVRCRHCVKSFTLSKRTQRPTWERPDNPWTSGATFSSSFLWIIPPTSMVLIQFISKRMQNILDNFV